MNTPILRAACATNAQDTHRATCATEVTDESIASGRIQLFPAGEFAARDGRPANIKDSKIQTWRLDATAAAKLIAVASARKDDYLLDYEHQIIHSQTNGKPVPAAGWFKALEWVEGKGLFATVDWTDEAKAAIKAKQYRYISPYFSFSPVTGEINGIINAALTNLPAIDGMAQAAASLYHTDPEESSMDKKLFERLLYLLNLPHTTTVDEMIGHLDKVKTILQGGNAAATSVNLIQTLEGHQSALAAVQQALDQATTKAAASVDLSLYVPVASVTALQQENTALKSQIAAADSQATTDLITAALTDGRLSPALKDWATELGKTNKAALSTYLGQAKGDPALSGQSQSATGKPAPSTAAAAFDNPESKKVAAMLGMTVEDLATGGAA